MILISLVLDRASAEAVAAFAIHSRVCAHHVTMAYNPTSEQRSAFTHLIGTEINFKTIGLHWDKNGQALSVSGVPSLNVFPHVTVSCAEGVAPVYSNQLLASQKLGRFEIKELELRGTVVEEIR